jgi:hypothetical protein
MPSTMAVEAFRQSGRSLGNGSGSRKARASISTVTGMRMTRATVSRTNDFALPATRMRW